MKKNRKFVEYIKDDNGETRVADITPSDILDEIDFSEIEEYLDNIGVGYYYLYDKKDIIDKSATLASFIRDSIDESERIAFNVVLSLDDITRELLKKELNDFDKRTTGGI